MNPRFSRLRVGRLDNVTPVQCLYSKHTGVVAVDGDGGSLEHHRARVLPPGLLKVVQVPSQRGCKRAVKC